MIDVSICIVNMSNIIYLEPCLRTIFKYTQEVVFEVIVVDKNSTDNSVEIIRREFPMVKLISGDITKGFTVNMNMALREAKGRYVVIFNDDTLLLSDAFSEMIKFMDKNPEYGGLGPKLLNVDGSFQIGPRGPATLWTLVCYELGLDLVLPKSQFISALRMSYWDPSRSCEMLSASGACFLVRQEVLKNVGFLEEALISGADDVDLSLRIRKAGWRLYYLANVSIVHYGEASKKRFQIQSMILLYKGWYWFVGRHYGWKAVNIYRFFAIISACMRIARLVVIFALIPKMRTYALDRIRGRFNILLLSLSPRFRRTVVPDV